MQIVGPEHLLQVVTSLQVRLVQEMFKVDRLKVDGLGLGGGDTNPRDVRDDSDAGNGDGDKLIEAASIWL